MRYASPHSPTTSKMSANPQLRRIRMPLPPSRRLRKHLPANPLLLPFLPKSQSSMSADMLKEASAARELALVYASPPRNVNYLQLTFRRATSTAAVPPQGTAAQRTISRTNPCTAAPDARLVSGNVTRNLSLRSPPLHLVLLRRERHAVQL